MSALPILFVDFVATDRGRIIATLDALGLLCAEEQAEQIRAHMGALPYDDDELEGMLLEYVEVDWDKCPEKLETSLKKLDADYRASTDPAHRRRVSRLMYLYTKGLEEHPKWWEQNCGCDTCLSYA